MIEAQDNQMQHPPLSTSLVLLQLPSRPLEEHVWNHTCTTNYIYLYVHMCIYM
jgi:hypothetical protein